MRLHCFYKPFKKQRGAHAHIHTHTKQLQKEDPHNINMSTDTKNMLAPDGSQYKMYSLPQQMNPHRGRNTRYLCASAKRTCGASNVIPELKLLRNHKKQTCRHPSPWSNAFHKRKCNMRALLSDCSHRHTTALSNVRMQHEHADQFRMQKHQGQIHKRIRTHLGSTQCRQGIMPQGYLLYGYAGFKIHEQ